MQIKTITTVAGVNEIDFGNDDSQTTAHYYWFKNLGSSTLYVSAMPNPVAGEDNVAELSAKGAASVETDEGKVYVLGAGKVEIHRTNSKFCPFELPSTGSGGGGGGSITVDSELSETSENPLQNKATTAAINEVKSELDTKSDINHIHDITASGNPVTLTNLQGEVPFSEMVVSGKNLISTAQAKALIGDNINGYYVNDNTSSRVFIQKLNPNTAYCIKKYDEGNRFRIMLFDNEPSTVPDKTVKQLVYSSDGSVTEYAFTTGADYLWLVFATHYAKSGDAVEPIAQLELGPIPTAYEPPITGRELTVNVCGKNLMKPNKSTVTLNGITATMNDDGSVTLNGTATANTYIGMWNNLYARSIGVGKIAVNAIDGQSISTYFMGIDRREGSSYIDRIAQSITNNGVGEITQEDVDNNRHFYVWVFIAANYTSNNLVFRPQLELGSTPTAYEPYHGSTTTITPDSNPYTIPNDIRQQDGLNNISVSAGELSVVGAQRNAAIKKIWDKFTSIGNDIADLYSKISKLEFDTSASIEANGQEIVAVRHALDSISDDLSSVTDNVAINTSDVATLKNENETLHAEIEALRALIETT